MHSIALRSAAAIVVWLIGLLVQSPASWASTIICNGSIRTADCKKADSVPSNHPVLFAFHCEGGGSGGTDGGATYASERIDVSKFSMRTNAGPLSGMFEDAGADCDDGPGDQLWRLDGHLFRFRGPLVAGQQHNIHYPMTYSLGSPVVRFEVTGPSALPAAEPPQRQGDGCSLAPLGENQPRSRWIPSLVFLGLALQRRRAIRRG